LAGARFGELAALLVKDFNPRQRTLGINAGKTGARAALLNQSAFEFFSRLASNRSADEFIFTQDGGNPWKPSGQNSPIKRALSTANLPGSDYLYAMRHTHRSCAIEGGVPLNIIAKNCGTSVRMIEKTYAKVLTEHARCFIEDGATKL
jgi:integrase